MINQNNNEIMDSPATNSVISLPCEECGQPNSILVTSRRHIQFCAFCSLPLNHPAIYEVRGFVYVLSNKQMPGIIKIGFTERDIESRVQELSSSTGVPTPFEIEAYYPTEDPIRDEAKVHQMFAEYRIENKEFFKLTVEDAVSRMSKIFKLAPSIFKKGLIIKKKVRWLKCKTCKWVWEIDYDDSDGDCPKCGWHIAKRLRTPYEP